MRCALLVLVVACGSSRAPIDEPIGNTVSSAERPRSPRGTSTVRGKVTDTTGEPLAGVTVIIEGLEGATKEHEPVALITDKHGGFEQRVPAGRYDVLFYYADVMVRRNAIDVNATTVVDQQIDPNRASADMLVCANAFAASCQ